ncbi:MAG: hypothetical protein SO164_04330 [Campylobacter sp.]|nr:hypothetical protein [Campylobacter sp.]
MSGVAGRYFAPAFVARATKKRSKSFCVSHMAMQAVSVKKNQKDIA